MTWRRTRGSITCDRFLLAIMSAIVVACATHSAPLTTASDPSMISASEIDSAHQTTAYELIRKLRPQFLQGRGKLSLLLSEPVALPRIYLDDQYYGDASTLRGILAETIESVRFYSAAEAQYKYGHDNAAGVIAVATKH